MEAEYLRTESMSNGLTLIGLEAPFAISEKAYAKRLELRARNR